MQMAGNALEEKTLVHKTRGWQGIFKQHRLLPIHGNAASSRTGV